MCVGSDLACDLVTLRSVFDRHVGVPHLINTKQNQNCPCSNISILVTISGEVLESPVNLGGLTVGKCEPGVARDIRLDESLHCILIATGFAQPLPRTTWVGLSACLMMGAMSLRPKLALDVVFWVLPRLILLGVPCNRHFRSSNRNCCCILRTTKDFGPNHPGKAASVL